MTRVAAGLIVACLVATSCTADDDADDASTTPAADSAPGGNPSTTEVPDRAPTTSAATSAPAASPPTTAVPPRSSAPPGTVAPEPATLDVGTLTAALADDALGGRDNGSEGSEAARELIIGTLDDLDVEPSGNDEWLQPFDAGINVIGMIPGSDLADEYVVVGAHYDHLGALGCNGRTPDDDICNGAADNAAGVAVALVVAEAIAEIGPRRSVVVALWDAEEDGLLGAEHYLTDPIVPVDRTVAYLNFDVLGSNLSPSLANWTVLIGAETGGPALVQATTTAVAGGSLDVARLSLVFGQGRSDHAPFADAGVPIVFFTDATNGCYHTVDDEVDQLDFGKLGAQIDIGARLAIDLAGTDQPPSFDAAAPVSTYADAASLLALLDAGRPDLGVLADGAIEIDALVADLETIVAAGASEYGNDDIATVLAGAAALIDVLDSGPCP